MLLRPVGVSASNEGPAAPLQALCYSGRPAAGAQRHSGLNKAALLLLGSSAKAQ